ncbi:hypothetical protein [Catenulispora rubra]|uniref:hypothetical protein n=1 Tax=Catenulispora rubra TaxID=280293 RepID=UPI001E5DC422|nr:hypothetical protein [Catenulispora rubra]
MSEEPMDGGGIAAAVDKTDWTQYVGQAASVKRRGERRRRRLQASTALGTTVAVVGVAVAVSGLDRGSVTRQGAASTQSSSAPAVFTGPPGGTASTTPGASSSQTSSTSASYPSFPAQLPTKPIFIADPGKVLQSGVIAAGAVSGHQWQLSYRVIPSGSAANSQPEVTQVDLSVDGKPASGAGGGEGVAIQASGYLAYEPGQGGQAAAGTFPMVVATGTPTPGVTSVDLRWKNGTVVQVPIRTALGTRIAAFAWDPANPPDTLEQVSPNGVSKITITHNGSSSWMNTTFQQTPKAIVPKSAPTVTTPSGTPNLSQTPQVTPHDSGLLGAGTVAGHQWQVAYEIIPSGSAANASDEAFCTDTTVDGKTRQDGCSSNKPFGGIGGGMSFTDSGGSGDFPLVADFGTGYPGTTAMGLEFADGTQTVTAVHNVEGAPMAALAFDPANGPTYLLEFGSYGEYRIPLSHSTHFEWRFNW